MLENRLFEALLDVVPFGAYAVDVNSYEIVYANKIIREYIADSKASYCWEAVYKQEGMCKWCSISKLEQRREKGKIVSEFFNESFDQWVKSYDELISWPDGRDVKYSILVDITDQKENQGSLIKSHADLAIRTKQLSKVDNTLDLMKLELKNCKLEARELFDALDEALIIVKEDVIVSINKKALELLEVKKEEILNQKVTSIIDINVKETPHDEVYCLKNRVLKVQVKSTYLTTNNTVKLSLCRDMKKGV